MSDPTAKPSTGDVDEISVPLIEETATLGTREVTTGKVVVRTVVDVEDRLLSQMITEERVDVERVAIGRVVDVAPQIRTEGDVTIIPVLQERVVVETQLVLVEEVRITRRIATEKVEIPVQLRTQRAVVEQS